LAANKLAQPPPLTSTNNSENLLLHTPEELKILFEALNSAPSYLSKRFILKHMLGWTDEDLKTNLTFIQEEAANRTIGMKGGY